MTNSCSCPFHPERPADARYSGTCSTQCERAVAQRLRPTEKPPTPAPRILPRRDRDRTHCSYCGARLLTDIERSTALYVERCPNRCFTEKASAQVIQHFAA